MSDSWAFDGTHLMMSAINGALDQSRPLIKAGALADAAREIEGWHNRFNGEIQDSYVKRIVDWLRQEAQTLQDSHDWVGFEARPMDSAARRAAMVGVALTMERRTLPGYSDDPEPERVIYRYVTEWREAEPIWVHQADEWELEQERKRKARLERRPASPGGI